jgi:hypothetical protein
MMQSGIAYQLPPLVPLIDATGSGSLHIPTPTARDWKDGRAKACKNVPVNGLLGRWVHLWPTPVSDDTGWRRNKYPQGGTALSTAIGGMLNPRWVEWLMGYPDGWTDLSSSETP